MKIEVSNGEIVDKLTILEIKLSRIKDEQKLVNVRKEHEALDVAVSSIMKRDDPLFRQLFEVNSRLWDIEDKCREFEKNEDFGEEFIQTVRQVYVNNDLRARIKKEINLQTGSRIVEEKSYEEY